MSDQGRRAALSGGVRGAVAVLLLAALIRGAVLWGMPGAIQQDPDGYLRLARTLREAGVLGWKDAATGAAAPTAYRPPLYPLVLAPLAGDGAPWRLAVGLFHWGLGTATVGLILVLGSWFDVRPAEGVVGAGGSPGRGAWSGGEAAATVPVERPAVPGWSWLAAILVACDPILLHQSAQVMTETLAAFLAVLALAVLSRFDRQPGPGVAGLAGFSQGLAALCRPTFLPWLWLCLVAVVVEPALRKRRWANALACLAGAGIALGAWGLRNARQLGQWRLTTTHGGYTLLLGNNPSFYRHLRCGPWRGVWTAEELDRAWLRRGHIPDARDPRWADLAVGRRLDLAPGYLPANWSEFDDDRLAYALAFRYMGEQPAWCAVSCLLRVARLWALTPRPLAADESLARRLLRYGCGAWYAVLWGLAVVGVASLGRGLLRPPWVWGSLLCVAFTSVHSLYWTDMRMRAPLMPFVCLLAAAGAARLGVAWCGRKTIADRRFWLGGPC